MVRLAAQHDNLQEAGYDLSRIGTHSLRSGGAVRLKLAGEDDGIIKKLGRWSGETYAKYIQPHIGPITGGCAARMARHYGTTTCTCASYLLPDGSTNTEAALFRPTLSAELFGAAIHSVTRNKNTTS